MGLWSLHLTPNHSYTIKRGCLQQQKKLESIENLMLFKALATIGVIVISVLLIVCSWLDFEQPQKNKTMQLGICPLGYHFVKYV